MRNCWRPGKNDQTDLLKDNKEQKMAFTKEELERYRKIVNAYMEKRWPPVYLRDQVDLSFRIKNHSIETFEIRAAFNDPQRMVEIPIAKTTWVKTQQIWRVFWQRADLKWHRYAPQPGVKSLEDLLMLWKRTNTLVFMADS
jgi:hypothetical protein